jgi:uncharacterized protein (DUF1501 family)
MTFDGIFERRTLLKATAAVGSLLPFSSMAAAAAASPDTATTFPEASTL